MKLTVCLAVLNCMQNNKIINSQLRPIFTRIGTVCAWTSGSQTCARRPRSVRSFLMLTNMFNTSVARWLNYQLVVNDNSLHKASETVPLSLEMVSLKTDNWY